MTRVLVLDADRLLPTADRARLAREHTVVILHGPADLVRRLPGPDPALVLLVDSPGSEDLCALVAGAGHRCLVLTGEADGPRLMRLLTAGATGYVEVAPAPGMWAAIATVLDGHAYVPPAMLGGLLHQLVQADRQQATPSQDERFARLSRREREVLDLLAAGNDQQGIARTLVISPQTARTHIQNVLGKLEVHSRLEAVALAHEHRQVGTSSGGGR